MNDVLSTVREHYDSEYVYYIEKEYVEKLNVYMEKEFRYKLDKPEKIYLLLHLTKIL